MVYQRFRTDWEKHPPSIEYVVLIERTVVEPDVLGGSLRRVPQG